MVQRPSAELTDYPNALLCAFRLDRMHAIRQHDQPRSRYLVLEFIAHRDRQSFVALAPNDHTGHINIAIIRLESPDGCPVGAMLLLPPRHGLTQHGLRCATVFGASQDAGDLARSLTRGAVLHTDSRLFRFSHHAIDHSECVTNGGFMVAK